MINEGGFIYIGVVDNGDDGKGYKKFKGKKLRISEEKFVVLW